MANREPTTIITMRNIPLDLWHRVRVCAAERRCLMTDVVVAALKAYLDRERDNAPRARKEAEYGKSQEA